MFAPSGDGGGLVLTGMQGPTALVPRPTSAMPLLPMTCITANNNESAAKKRIFRDGIWALASPGVSVFGMLDIVVNDVQPVHALIRPAFHFFKRPDKRPTCLPREANAFVVFSFSQNSSGHLSATLMRVFQSESSSCRANATMTPMM